MGIHIKRLLLISIHKGCFKPVHVIPFPLKLSRQVQKKLPIVSVQSAYISQLSVPRAHSSISARGGKYTNPRTAVIQVATCIQGYTKGQNAELIPKHP